MSEENVEIVRKALDAINAFAQGRLPREAFAEVLDPQVEFHWHGERGVPDVQQDVLGVADFIDAAEQIRSVWVDPTWEPLDFIEAPEDRVLVPTRGSGRGQESGIPIEIHFSLLWTIRGGRVHKVDNFQDHAEALEAAGLSE